MKVRPAKPQFFKPIQPGFKRALKIPNGFLKYLKGHEHEHAVLKRGSKKWLVKLNGQRLEEGWEKFAEEHDLRLGDLLIFRHEGEMEFQVTIFDSSHCDREYAEYLQDEEEAHIVKDPSKKFEITEAAPQNPIGQSHVVCTVRSYCFSKGYFRLPLKFTKANGFRNKKCGLIIRDERQRSWNLKLYTSCHHVYIGGRWAKFRAENDLKVGDRIVFEVVTNGERPIWKFHRLRKNASLQPKGKRTNSDNERVSSPEKPNSNIISSCKAVPNVEAAKDLHLGHPHFICTMKPYNLSKCFLRVPSTFARQHGLRDRKCTILIRDEQRSWTFTLYSCSMVTYIGGGWHNFCIANCLKEGDRVMFGIVANGEKPILKFHDLRDNASFRPEGKKTNSDTEKVSTQDLRGNASLQPEGKKINLDAKSVYAQGITDLTIQTSNVSAPKAQVPASTSVDDANAKTTLVCTM